LVDPAQDRLGTLQVITPGHPLIPSRDPEVSQVTARRPGGAHSASDVALTAGVITTWLLIPTP
jgi:hypothetical protein